METPPPPKTRISLLKAQTDFSDLVDELNFSDKLLDASSKNHG